VVDGVQKICFAYAIVADKTVNRGLKIKLKCFLVFVIRQGEPLQLHPTKIDFLLSKLKTFGGGFTQAKAKATLDGFTS